MACIAGALLGAASGTPAIPADWLDTLPRRTDIASLADRLVAQGEAYAASQAPGAPLVVIADLHGNLDLFELLLAKVDESYPQARHSVKKACRDERVGLTKVFGAEPRDRAPCVFRD